MTAKPDRGRSFRPQDPAAADTVFARANELILANRLDEAIDLLDGLADRAALNADPVAQARARRLGAATSRIVGDIDGAVLRGHAAAAVRGADRDTWVSIRVELGESLALADDTAGAVTIWRELLAAALQPPLDDATRSAVLRKLAVVLGSAGETSQALGLLEQARRLIAGAGSPVAAARLAVETAGLACAGAHPSTAALAERARRQAIEAGDPVSQADVELLAAAHALRAGALREALESCRTARRHALDAVAPLQYVAAAVAFARVADAVDERVQAYESLVVGWVTLADLLGDEAARSVFGVELAAMRERWGDEAFAEARGAYDERRRCELGRRR